MLWPAPLALRAEAVYGNILQTTAQRSAPPPARSSGFPWSIATSQVSCLPFQISSSPAFSALRP